MATATLPPPEKEEDELKGSEAPLLEHLIELRKRLIYSLAAVVVFFIICFIFAKPIYDLLVLPFKWAGGTNNPAREPSAPPQVRASSGASTGGTN